MKLDKITPAVLKMMREDFDKALEPVLKKYGLSSLKAGGASYTPNTFTLKVEGVLDDAKQSEENAKTSGAYARLLGLPEDVVGKVIVANGKRFKVTRIDLGKPKYPVIATGEHDNRSYKFPAENLRFV